MHGSLLRQNQTVGTEGGVRNTKCIVRRFKAGVAGVSIVIHTWRAPWTDLSLESAQVCIDMYLASLLRSNGPDDERMCEPNVTYTTPNRARFRPLTRKSPDGIIRYNS